MPTYTNENEANPRWTTVDTTQMSLDIATMIAELHQMQLHQFAGRMNHIEQAIKGLEAAGEILISF